MLPLDCRVPLHVLQDYLCYPLDCCVPLHKLTVKEKVALYLVQETDLKSGSNNIQPYLTAVMLVS
jgi:hypothetical protein